jgi:type VI secretion system secreted protein VgrG
MKQGALTFINGSGARLHVRSASGAEALSTLYEYEIDLECASDQGLSSGDIDALFKAPCALEYGGGSSAFEVHGMLKALRLVGANEASPVLYRATLVPRLWLTTRQLRSRVYQDVTVQALVGQVLELSGLEAALDLGGSYPTMEYVVQYAETDFAFLSRQLEHWGIFYFFRQEQDGEVLVIADHDKVFETCPGYESLRFAPARGTSSSRGRVQTLSALHAPQPAVVMLRDYNYRTPSTPLLESAQVDQRTGFGEQWIYGEHYKTADEGARLASIRAEQMLARRERYEGLCTAPGLAPGHRFELTDCPLADLEITYLVTSVRPRLEPLADSGDEAYQFPFTAVPLGRDDPKSPPYRAERTTPKPRISGFVHGVIDGEVAGAAAPIDDQGRYKVLLPLDSVAQPGGKASRWIRRSQPLAGPEYGMHFPLHVGAEVVIVHLDGDPDRPVIVGAVPNPNTASPVVQANATQSRIRTRAGILVEFEDDAT